VAHLAGLVRVAVVAQLLVVLGVLAGKAKS
jgi:hypothetical protein